jgi:hypothetical protein
MEIKGYCEGCNNIGDKEHDHTSTLVPILRHHSRAEEALTPHVLALLKWDDVRYICNSYIAA